MTSDANRKQYAVTADPVALRRLALRRALAAAYPLQGPSGAGSGSAEDDAAAVRRAAGAALAYLDAPGAAHPHSMTMPMMGHAVIAVGWGLGACGVGGWKGGGTERVRL